MDLLPLPPHSVDALLNRGISPRTMLAIRLVLTCLHQSCEWVADDTGPERRDDATSTGGLRWRRTRNFSIELLEDEVVPELADVRADVTDNALQVPVDGCRLSFYSARNGIDHPDLSGTSKTKKAVVSEMQMQLTIPGELEPPARIVLLYDADRDGLLSAAVGTLDSERSWAWAIGIFDRDVGELDADLDNSQPAPGYADQQEPELPAIEPHEIDSDIADPQAYDEQKEPELPKLDALPDDEHEAGAESDSAN